MENHVLTRYVAPHNDDDMFIREIDTKATAISIVLG